MPRGGDHTLQLLRKQITATREGDHGVLRTPVGHHQRRCRPRRHDRTTHPQLRPFKLSARLVDQPLTSLTSRNFSTSAFQCRHETRTKRTIWVTPVPPPCQQTCGTAKERSYGRELRPTHKLTENATRENFCYASLRTTL